VEDARLAALSTLLPRLHVTSAPLRGERRFGVAFDGTGWIAAMELEPQPAMLSGGSWSRAVPLQRMAGLLRVDDIRLSSVQLLVHTVPAPAGWLDTGWLPSVSYQRIRPVTVPALRQTWLVLRLDPARGAEALTARGGGVQGAHRALKRAVGRALEVLDGAGVPARPLDDAALREALAVNLLGAGSDAGRDPAADPAAASAAASAAAGPAAASAWAPAGVDRPVESPGVETWSAWLASGTAQATWWLAGWPAGREPVEHLVQLLQGVQATFGVVSFTLHADDAGGPPAARVLLRACARPDAAGDLAGALEAAATGSGARLRRLDGEHGPGLCATLPLGGGTR
jgi:type VII secretion protein EccE